MARVYRGRPGPRIVKRGLALAVAGLVGLVVILGTIQLGATGDWDDPFLRIGVLEEPKTLNPWLASDAWSLRVLGLIYQPLYIRNPRMRLIPWLAAANPRPEYDGATVQYYARLWGRRRHAPWRMLSLPTHRAGAVVYTVDLRRVQWSDGSALTADDVIFTGELIRRFRIPMYYSRWEFVTRMEKLGPRRVRFVLDRPEPAFTRRTVTTPIVQKKQWSAIAAQAARSRNPLIKLIRYKLSRPIGCGPFVLKRWRHGVYLFLTKNPRFFGQGKVVAGLRLGPHIPGIIVKIYGTSDAAVLALRKGAIDFYWNTILPGYLRQLRGEEDVKLFTNQKSGFYFFGFNLRRKPFNDVNFRRAVATMIDRQFIIDRILQKAAKPLMSFVPAGSDFHCPGLTPCGDGLSLPERVKSAVGILRQAGYTWDRPPRVESGRIVKGYGLKNPQGRPVRDFTILTPPADYDPGRAMAGIMIQEWLRLLGIPAVARPMGFGALIHRVKHRHDFDCFVFGYGNLRPYPSYLWNFYTSAHDRRGDWNMSGYRNRAYDYLADRARHTVDEDDLRELVFRLQRMLTHDIPYFPLYNPTLVEGIRKDRFTGWVMMMGGIGNIWSFSRLRPVPAESTSEPTAMARP